MSCFYTICQAESASMHHSFIKLVLFMKHSSTSTKVLQYRKGNTPVLSGKYYSTAREVLALHENTLNNT